MSHLLITGASGLLGANLARDFAPDHEVSGVFHRNRVPIAGVRMIGADLSQQRLARMVVGKVKPEIVIHCAAGTDVDRCQRDEEWAHRLNRDMAEHVAAAAAANGASLVHISTDAVFDGQKGDYSEEDRPEPVNIYGRTKLAGEEAVLDAHPGALIVRTNLFGRSLGTSRGSLAEWFLGELREGESPPGFTDVHFSPILVNDLGPLLLDLVGRGARGLFHIGGATCLSKFEFGRRLAAAFGYAPERIRPSTLEEVDLEAPRPKKLCLDCSKLERELGREVPTVDAGLGRLVQQVETLRGVDGMKAQG